GFTLLELLAVLVILAALATIAIPIFINKSDESKQTAHKQNLTILQKQGNAYLLSLMTMPEDGEDLIDELETYGYIKEIPTNPITESKDYHVIYHGNGLVDVNTSGVQVFAEVFANEDNIGVGTTADWISGTLAVSSESQVLSAINNLGGTSGDQFNKIIKDNQGNYICVGYSLSNLSSISGETESDSNTVGASDFVIAKFNSNLQLMAINNFGGAVDDTFNDIIQDSNGDYVCVGITRSDLTTIDGESVGGSTCEGNYDFVIAKFNSNLQLTTINNLGGIEDDLFNGVIQDNQGNYICTGTSDSNLIGINGGIVGGANTSGGRDFVITKFDNNLQITTMNNLGGTLGDEFYDIIKDNDNNYVCVGASRSNLGSINGESVSGFNTQGTDDFVIAKFNSSLQLMAINNLGGTNEDIYRGIIQNITGDYVCVGYSFSDLSSISGETVSGTNTQGNEDFVISKFNNDLQLTAINNLGGTGYDYLCGLIQDNSGKYVSIGFTSSNLGSISGETASGDANQGGYDFVINKFDDNLDLISINNLGGTLNEVIYGIVQDSIGDYICAGYSTSNLSTISGESVSGTNTAGGTDFVLTKFTNDITYNPASNVLVSNEMSLGSALDNIKIKVDATVPDGTSYAFSYSTNGTDFTVVGNASLNGNTNINIGGSSSLWWKIVLTGDASSSPQITGVTVYK
ncbi:MAG TPA: hypothetical protein DCP90_02315, partial [Clostridiales bacterium]|nr:hypothetical protein [Clostridiales bacterium]